MVKVMMSNENKETKMNSAGSARRTFLVRSSATALIASLPVKATWARGGSSSGCMVSGTLSGNQSAVCESTKVEGFSPDKWKRTADNNSSFKEELEDIKWKDVFSGDPAGSEVGKGSNLFKVLRKGAYVDKNLVAGYLNAKYNKYELASGVTALEYAGYLEQEAIKNQSALVDALEATYI